MKMTREIMMEMMRVVRCSLRGNDSAQLISESAQLISHLQIVISRAGQSEVIKIMAVEIKKLVGNLSFQR